MDSTTPDATPELVTVRVLTPVCGWDWLAEPTVQRTPLVDALIDAGRLRLLADPAGQAHDQGDEPADAERIVAELTGATVAGPRRRRSS